MNMKRLLIGLALAIGASHAAHADDLANVNVELCQVKAAAFYAGTIGRAQGWSMETMDISIITKGDKAVETNPMLLGMAIISANSGYQSGQGVMTDDEYKATINACN
jgi:hypothetical protein